MRKVIPLALLAVLTIAGAGCTARGTQSSVTPQNDSSVSGDSASTMKWTYQGQLPDDQIENKQIRIHMDAGDIVFKLYPDVAPITVSNMIYLASNGYYDGLTFHRVADLIPPTHAMIVQGGDPSGNGTGGPGYNIPAEFNDLHHKRGMVAMARAMDPDSAGSQFYITLADVGFLDNNYTVFGEVTEGIEVADKIIQGDIMRKVTVEDVK